MKIQALSVRDFKRVATVEISPGERSIILIGGSNAQGKTSILDALTAAFGGTRQAPAEPVRRGAKRAEIVVALDNGVEIRRTFTAGGTAELHVTDTGGTVRRPQERLDALIGSRFLDPLAFLALPAADQRAALLALIPEAAEIARIDRERAEAFTERTAIGRELRSADARIAGRGPAPIAPPAALNVEALRAKAAAIASSVARERDHDATIARAGRSAESEDRAIADIDRQIARLHRDRDEAVSRGGDGHRRGRTDRASLAR